MIIRFYKYHGTGNDFILIDNRSMIFRNYAEKQELISYLCHRRFGIGADGLMLVNNHDDYDFEMVYFNADGKEGSMCGNGGRCIVSYAHSLGMINENAIFSASDGIHEAQVISSGKNESLIRLKMADVSVFSKVNDHYEINTGSPHYVKFVNDPENTDVVNIGRMIRYSAEFPEGTNVNFVKATPQGLYVRTYERGVEDETLSCGTGVTASSVAAYLDGFNNTGSMDVITRGGALHVDFEKTKDKFEHVWLTGPAVLVFKGEIVI